MVLFVDVTEYSPAKIEEEMHTMSDTMDLIPSVMICDSDEADRSLLSTYKNSGKSDKYIVDSTNK